MISYLLLFKNLFWKNHWNFIQRSLSSEIYNFNLKDKGRVRRDYTRNFSWSVSVLRRASDNRFLPFLELANANVPPFHNLSDTHSELDWLAPIVARVKNFTTQKPTSVMDFHCASFWHDLPRALVQSLNSKFSLLEYNTTLLFSPIF